MKIRVYVVNSDVDTARETAARFNALAFDRSATGTNGADTGETALTITFPTRRNAADFIVAINDGADSTLADTFVNEYLVD